MRYRMELINDKPVVRNVETDVIPGSLEVGSYPSETNPGRTVYFCTVRDVDGREISSAWTASPTLCRLHMGISAAANNQAWSGYPAFKNCTQKPDPVRVEWLLGSLVADAASIIADGGPQQETKNKLANRIAEIFDIRWASSFGSYNGETQEIEPYFWNPRSSSKRSGFDEAARFYGMYELRFRFPNESEVFLQKLISFVLELVDSLLKDLLPVKLPPLH